MQNRPCTHRAEWRLLRGRPAQRLSAHYQLGCDYGTSLITIYQEGDPVFLCASHATTIGPQDDNSIAGVRVTEPQSVDHHDPFQNDERSNPPEPAAVRQSSYALSETAGPFVVGRVEAKIAPSQKRPVRDLTYGNSAKALVDETIWNMPTGDYQMYRTALEQGKPAIEAAQSAGGQLAIIHRKISEYTIRIEAILAESRAKISVHEVIDKPFEHAVLEVIGNITMSEAQKDLAIDHLGAFQEQINRGLGREITPLEAHRIARAIGDQANWGTGACPSEELKSASGAVYNSVRNVIRVAVPEAYDLQERLANLYAAKSDLENVPAAKPQPLHFPVGSGGRKKWTGSQAP